MGRYLPIEELDRSLAEARAAGRRIVFTNGCFDILHRGHVEYLAVARSLGDILVVGVNSDASVRGLKGTGRPVNPLADRAAVLAALASVDYVVAFEEATPEALIRRVSPQVLVKGGDYRPEEIVGAAWVRSHGGQVIVAPLVPGQSTTDLLDRLGRGASPRPT